jgi:hypothetical protein
MIVYFGDGPLYQKTQSCPDPVPFHIFVGKMKPIEFRIDGSYSPFVDLERVVYERVGYYYRMAK